MKTSALPIRTIHSARSIVAPWVCRRCLATQTNASATSSEIPNYDPSLPAKQRIGPDGSIYALKKTDFYLKKPLPQRRIPTAHLQHSTSDLLHQNEQAQREEIEKHKPIVGVVVSSGKMAKTVKVRVAGQTWNKRIGKMFHSHINHLVHDPNSSLVTGDVVELHRLRVSRHVGHVVASIVSPFGEPIESRPPIPSPDDRLSVYKEKRFAKLNRRKLRVQAADGDAAAIQQLTDMGLNPGAGTEAGVGKRGNVQKNVGQSRDGGKGAILGAKGQKLPEGVLPGGKQEVGKLDRRAKHNKEKAMKLDENAEKNVLKAKEKGEELEASGMASDSALKA